MSYASRVAYFATSGQQEFDLPFPFIHRDHIIVRVNGAVSEKTWVSDSRLRLPRASILNDAVEIRRKTPIDGPLVKFQNGSNLTEEELNLAVLQLLYHSQEVDDLYNTSLNAGMVRLGDRMNIPSTPDEIIDELVSMALADALLAEFRQRISDIDLNAEEIIQIGLRLTNAQATIAQQWAAQANAANVAATLRNDFNSLVGVVDGLVNIGNGTGIATLIQSEANARILGDSAIVSTIDLIGAANSGKTAFNLDMNRVMANSTHSMAQKLNAVSAQADANSRTIFAQEIVATSNAISSQGSIITGLTSNVAGVRADIISEQNTRANAVAALVGTVALLGANAVGGSSFILDQNKVQVVAGETLGQRFTTISANSANLAAVINTETTARIANGVTLTTMINGMGTRVDGANAAIQSEALTRASADSTEANARIALAATIGPSISAAIATESSARANAISAETSARNAAVSQLQTGLASANAAIVNEGTTRTTAIGAETTARNQQAATFTAGLASANAAILTETNTRASADSATANTISLLGAKNGGSTAFILNQSTVFTNATTSLGTRLSGIDSQIGSASASVVNLSSALASANSVNAQAISGVNGTINGVSASVTNLTQVVSGSGGLTTRAGVVLNNNGHITGWALNNNGASGSFNVVADEFAFVAPNGGSPVKIASMNASKVVFNTNVEIHGDLLVTGSINTPKIANNSITVIDSVSTVNRLYGQGSGGSYYDEETGEWVYYGGKQTALSYTINLAYPAKLICISSFTHDYVASGSPGFNYDISVNGGGLIATGGQGVRVVGSCISGYISLPAGTHTVTTNWQGDTSSITMNSANLVIMAVYK